MGSGNSTSFFFKQFFYRNKVDSMISVKSSFRQTQLRCIIQMGFECDSNELNKFTVHTKNSTDFNFKFSIRSVNAFSCWAWKFDLLHSQLWFSWKVYSVYCWFACSCTNNKLWRYPRIVDWILPTYRCSLVLSHAFHSMVSMCI